MDYLFIGDYNETKNYLLVLKDDFSHFCELIECTSADAATAANAILQWSSRYGTPQLLISDTAAHFKNQLLDELCHKTQMTQSFTVAYCPWINGSVEHLNRDILQVVRVMLLEWKIEQENWMTLLPLIQANLNHSPVASLANHTPAEVFMGLRAATPLQKVLIGKDAIANNLMDASNFTPDIQLAVDGVRSSINDMHNAITTAKEKQTKRNKSNQRGAQPVNFHVGDFVLWSRVDAKTHTNKLAVKWIGPFRVIGTKVNSFDIEHRISGATRNVHASRLKLYADSSLDINEEIIQHIANQDIYLTVDKFKRHKKHPSHGYEVLVGWEGLEEIEDSWEPIKNMYEDVPDKLQEYVDSSDDNALARYVSNLSHKHTKTAPSRAAAKIDTQKNKNRKPCQKTKRTKKTAKK